MSVIRKCVCCGKEYEFCPGCPRKDQPAWMVTFCSEPCKELFNIVTAYNTKRISKADVKKYVTEHKLDASKFTGPVKKVLDEVVVEEVVKDATPAPAVKAAPAPAKASDNGGEPYDHRFRRAKKRKHRL